VFDGLSLRHLSGLSLAVGLAVIRAIETLLPKLQDNLQLKWSNDIWIDQRKVAGILCETVSQPTAQTTQVIVGIGLNHSADFAKAGLAEQAIHAISLHQLSPSMLDEMALLEQLRHQLMQTIDLFIPAKTALENLGLTTLLSELRCRDALFNQPVSIEIGTELLLGEAIGIDSQGRLQVKFHDRSPLALTSGRVRLL
jgi:BirA family biotin operon repressor/biotin-[acetyl-CoA-carboxylase] ligase